jgi:hypothetical protein
LSIDGKLEEKERHQIRANPWAHCGTCISSPGCCKKWLHIVLTWHNEWSYTCERWWQEVVAGLCSSKGSWGASDLGSFTLWKSLASLDWWLHHHVANFPECVCLCACVCVSLPHLVRTPAIGFRAHPLPLWPDLNS